MGGTTKNGARSVTHKDKVRYPDRKRFAFVKWVFDTQACVETKFVCSCNSFFCCSDLRALGLEIFYLGIRLGKFFGEGVVWRQCNKTCTK